MKVWLVCEIFWPKFFVDEISQNFWPKFFVLKLIVTKFLGPKFFGRKVCSSFRAEMMAIEAALKYINKHLEKCEIEFDRTLCVVDAYRLSVGYHIPKRRSQRPTYYSWR